MNMDNQLSGGIKMHQIGMTVAREDKLRIPMVKTL